MGDFEKTIIYSESCDSTIRHLRIDLEENILDNLAGRIPGLLQKNKSFQIDSLFNPFIVRCREILEVVPREIDGWGPFMASLNNLENNLREFEKLDFDKKVLENSDEFGGFRKQLVDIQNFLVKSLGLFYPSSKELELLETIKKSPTRRLTIEILGESALSPKYIYEKIVRDKNWVTTLTTVTRALAWFMEPEINLVREDPHDLRKRGKNYELTLEGERIYRWLIMEKIGFEEYAQEGNPVSLGLHGDEKQLPIEEKRNKKGDNINLEKAGVKTQSGSKEFSTLWTGTLEILKQIDLNYTKNSEKSLNTEMAKWIKELRNVIWDETDPEILSKLTLVLQALLNLQVILGDFQKTNKEYYQILQTIFGLLF